MITQYHKLALTAAFGLALAFTFSCYDEYKPNDRIVKRKEKISGISQKGPFTAGATVKVYELNRKMERTGEPYEGTTDGNGNFVIEIENGILSPYISLEVSGKYVNEVSGGQSNGAITLNAVADVSEKSKVNINVFTHLEYDKVLKLARSGEKFEDAKKEAQKEVLNALGMSEAGVKSSEEMSLFGGSKGDSLLLVASVFLQGNRSTRDVSSLLNAIGSEIKGYGALSEVTKDEVINGLANLDMGEVIGNIQKLAPSVRVPNLGNIDIEDIAAKIDVYSSGASGTFRDSRDGKVYNWVKIGKQTWMAENLNYARGSKCYENRETMCDTYGKLYDWATAMQACPSGWHLPSDDEWQTLVNFAGGNESAGNVPNGFSAMPGGLGNPNGSFRNVGDYGYWWSSSEADNGYAYNRSMIYGDRSVYQISYDKSFLLSVRCLED